MLGTPNSALFLVGIILLFLIGIAVWQKLYKGIPVLILVYLIYAVIKITSSSSQIDRNLKPPMELPPIEEKVEKVPVETMRVKVDTTHQLSPVPAETVQIAEESEAIVEESARSNMVLKRIVICREVTSERVTIGIDKIFPNDVGELSCFTAIENLGQPDSVIHAWYYEGREMATIRLEVGRSLFWRTWSRKTIQPEWVGEWRVIVFDSKGVQLGSTTFQIVKKAEESVEQEKKENP